MDDSSYLCPTSTTTDINSTFMDINIQLTIGAIIAPIIGIFYLFGAIFIIPSDQLDNRRIFLYILSCILFSIVLI